MLTTYLYPPLMLRLSGAMPHLRLHAFLAWTRTLHYARYLPTPPTDGGTAVAQLVQALRYKSEGHWFDSR